MFTAQENFFGAGIAFVEPAQRKVLLLLRAPGSTFPNTWNVPGGKREPDEHVLQTAVRETLEEMGFFPDHYMRKVVQISMGKRFYALFIATVTPGVAHALGPQLRLRKEEHTNWGWFSLDAPPSSMHPGLRSAWPALLSAV